MAWIQTPVFTPLKVIFYSQFLFKITFSNLGNSVRLLSVQVCKCEIHSSVFA